MILTIGTFLTGDKGEPDFNQGFWVFDGGQVRFSRREPCGRMAGGISYTREQASNGPGKPESAYSVASWYTSLPASRKPPTP